ncbi:hypothetical protein EKO27_g7395 [Xylaria grammica]|uniref:Uncharacterized protein n=1 Tax=Xylaria grammica TaxID=363999 RepID=A0A439CZY5_9PEZI|nr:hypothetical protein EKO27_g7395 [Xylaria grammica]
MVPTNTRSIGVEFWASALLPKTAYNKQKLTDDDDDEEEEQEEGGGGGGEEEEEEERERENIISIISIIGTVGTVGIIRSSPTTAHTHNHNSTIETCRGCTNVWCLALHREWRAESEMREARSEPT